MWIGPDMIDSHFGSGPVYGTLAESSRARVADLGEGMNMSDRPTNATSSELQSSIVSFPLPEIESI
jgi:hypothetical protein